MPSDLWLRSVCPHRDLSCHWSRLVHCVRTTARREPGASQARAGWSTLPPNMVASRSHDPVGLFLAAAFHCTLSAFRFTFLYAHYIFMSSACGASNLVRVVGRSSASDSSSLILLLCYHCWAFSCSHFLLYAFRFPLHISLCALHLRKVRISNLPSSHHPWPHRAFSSVLSLLS